MDKEMFTQPWGFLIALLLLVYAYLMFGVSTWFFWVPFFTALFVSGLIATIAILIWITDTDRP